MLTYDAIVSPLPPSPVQATAPSPNCMLFYFLFVFTPFNPSARAASAQVARVQALARDFPDLVEAYTTQARSGPYLLRHSFFFSLKTLRGGIKEVGIPACVPGRGSRWVCPEPRRTGTISPAPGSAGSTETRRQSARSRAALLTAPGHLSRPRLSRPHRAAALKQALFRLVRDEGRGVSN